MKCGFGGTPYLVCTFGGMKWLGGGGPYDECGVWLDDPPLPNPRVSLIWSKNDKLL